MPILTLMSLLAAVLAAAAFTVALATLAQPTVWGAALLPVALGVALAVRWGTRHRR